MQCDQRASICLSHGVEFFPHDVDRGCLNRVRVPKVDDVDYEFWVNVLEQIVPVVMLVDIRFDIGGFLEEQVGVHRGRLRPVHLRLGD